ncbi:hypothetical protein [Alkalimonas mucilaginosa]|uniref:Ankyrin repeat domain-containing protein n=1 Tax=Alkalimonas mucilaginosa TaxID=3057676 RepID=A0ABU7JK68_9GAMM|nr:hypothetical protein [Alkalimonas sp. MEB004]MEE2026102.1 hypothetical protein [Alkalimonas sp. MEB004]
MIKPIPVAVFKAFSLLPVFFSAALCLPKADAAETLPASTPPTAVPFPAMGSCAKVAFHNPSSPKWGLPLYLCHYSAADFNALKAQPVLDKSWLPNKESYQGLADNLLDSRLPSIALAHGQRWYRMLSAAENSSSAVVQLTELISPYLGCELQLTDTGFTDPCLGANWDKLGRLLAPVSDLPNQSLRQFPFRLYDNLVVLGEADATLNWQLDSFAPDLQDATVPLLERIGKGLFWGQLDEVTVLWPSLIAKGPLTKRDQVELFIMAIAKEQTAAVLFLAAQGLNPQATNEYGDSALSIAKMLENEVMVQLLSELGASFDSQAQ